MTGPEAGGPAEGERRLRRLRIRSWRRGTREMDLILGPFADGAGAALSADEIVVLEEMLSENDQDLYGWFSGASPAPDRYRALLGQVRAFHRLA